MSSARDIRSDLLKLIGENPGGHTQEIWYVEWSLLLLCHLRVTCQYPNTLYTIALVLKAVPPLLRS